MKLHSFLAVAAVFAATALHAQSVNVQKLDDEKYTVANGDVTLTVDVAHGAKILSFKLGEKEVIAQNPAAAPASDEGQPRRRWFNPNSYGSTFWTSPQAEWNWPPVAEYDSLPYSVESADASTLVVLGQPSRFGYRVQKAFSADPADGAFIITYSIINESGETRKVAPWAITRVPNGGYLEFDAKAEDVTPLDLMKVSFNENGARLDIDVADQNRKINVDAPTSLRRTPPRVKRRSRFTSTPASPSSKSRRRVPTRNCSRARSWTGPSAGISLKNSCIFRKIIIFAVQPNFPETYAKRQS